MSTPELVWYCAYGSNLDGERFGRYLAACRDPSPPVADAPVLLKGGLRFERSSPRWGGGGVAFLDPEAHSTARGRRWLVTAEQFADVFAQENGSGPGSTAVDARALRGAGHLDLGTGWYGRLVWCGELDGLALVTFTAPGRTEPRSPSAPYLAVIASGLRAAHGLDGAAVADYLLSAPGVAGTWTRHDLASL